MTPTEADKAQQWENMGGAEAWILINRHADDWDEIRELMEAWRRAEVNKAVRRCAELADELGSKYSITYKASYSQYDGGICVGALEVGGCIRAEFPEAFK